MLDDGPLPGDLILHTCNGRARVWVMAGHTSNCHLCGAPAAGDVPYIPNHAHFFCRFCQRIVGLCSSVMLAEVAEGARQVLISHDRTRKRNEGTP